MDLFNNYENLPQEVKTILDKYRYELSYKDCETLVNELNKVGYTCEYYLDAIPFNLRKL